MKKLTAEQRREKTLRFVKDRECLELDLHKTKQCWSTDQCRCRKRYEELLASGLIREKIDV